MATVPVAGEVADIRPQSMPETRPEIHRTIELHNDQPDFQTKKTIPCKAVINKKAGRGVKKAAENLDKSEKSIKFAKLFGA